MICAREKRIVNFALDYRAPDAHSNRRAHFFAAASR